MSPDVEEADTEWFGPAALTLSGALSEAFGDLVVGWIGEPFEIESTDEWASWGLRDAAGRLVAVATVVTSGGGWDPSHARYCVIPRPKPPPPPLTLFISNQSLADSTVSITITIDGETVIDQDFDVEGQHNWVEFTPAVGPGDHTITATSSTGAEFSVDFNLPEDEPRWAVIDYWYYPEEGHAGSPSTSATYRSRLAEQSRKLRQPRMPLEGDPLQAGWGHQGSPHRLAALGTYPASGGGTESR